MISIRERDVSVLTESVLNESSTRANSAVRSRPQDICTKNCTHKLRLPVQYIKYHGPDNI
jgi:hypothetical protein